MAKFKFEDLLYIKGRIGWQALSKNEYFFREFTTRWVTKVVSSGIFWNR